MMIFFYSVYGNTLAWRALCCHHKMLFTYPSWAWARPSAGAQPAAFRPDGRGRERQGEAESGRVRGVTLKEWEGTLAYIS